MTVRTIKGIVRGGKIEPSEVLDAPEGTEVDINVPAQPTGKAGTMITFGMFSKTGRSSLAEEDVEQMKGQWEREWERSWERLDSNE